MNLLVVKLVHHQTSVSPETLFEEAPEGAHVQAPTPRQ